MQSCPSSGAARDISSPSDSSNPENDLKDPQVQKPFHPKQRAGNAGSSLSENSLSDNRSDVMEAATEPGECESGWNIRQVPNLLHDDDTQEAPDGQGSNPEQSSQNAKTFARAAKPSLDIAALLDSAGKARENRQKFQAEICKVEPFKSLDNSHSYINIKPFLASINQSREIDIAERGADELVGRIALGWWVEKRKKPCWYIGEIVDTSADEDKRCFEFFTAWAPKLAKSSRDQPSSELCQDQDEDFSSQSSLNRGPNPRKIANRNYEQTKVTCWNCIILLDQDPLIREERFRLVLNSDFFEDEYHLSCAKGYIEQNTPLKLNFQLHDQNLQVLHNRAEQYLKCQGLILKFKDESKCQGRKDKRAEFFAYVLDTYKKSFKVSLLLSSDQYRHHDCAYDAKELFYTNLELCVRAPKIDGIEKCIVRVKILRQAECEKLEKKVGMKVFHCCYLIKQISYDTSESKFEFNHAWKLFDHEKLKDAGFSHEVIQSCKLICESTDAKGFLTLKVSDAATLSSSARSDGKYIGQRVRRYQFNEQDEPIAACEGCIVSCIPAMDQGAEPYVCERTGEPSDLWQLKYDDKGLGIEDLDEMEVLEAIKLLGEPLPDSLLQKRSKRVRTSRQGALNSTGATLGPRHASLEAANELAHSSSPTAQVKPFSPQTRPVSKHRKQLHERSKKFLLENSELPFYLSSVMNTTKVENLGVLSSIPNFHDESHLWPVGFKAVHTDLASDVKYELEIQERAATEGQMRGPEFKITVKMLQCTLTVAKETPESAMRAAMLLQREQGVGIERLAADRVLQEEDSKIALRFGLSDPLVRRRIEASDETPHCSNYQFVEKEKGRKRLLPMQSPTQEEAKRPCLSLNSDDTEEKWLEKTVCDIYKEGFFAPAMSRVEWKRSGITLALQALHNEVGIHTNDCSKISALVQLRSEHSIIMNLCHKKIISNSLHLKLDAGSDAVSVQHIKLEWEHDLDDGFVKANLPSTLISRATTLSIIWHNLSSDQNIQIGAPLKIVLVPELVLFVSNYPASPSSECIVDLGAHICVEVRLKHGEDQTSGISWLSLMETLHAEHTLEAGSDSEFEIKSCSFAVRPDNKGLVLWEGQLLEIGSHRFSCKGEEGSGLSESIVVNVVAMPDTITVWNQSKKSRVVPNVLHAGSKSWQEIIVVKNKVGHIVLCEVEGACFVLESNGAEIDNTEVIEVTSFPRFIRDQNCVCGFELKLAKPLPLNARGKYTLQVDVRWNQQHQIMLKSIRCSDISFQAIYSSDPNEWSSKDVVEFVRKQGIETDLDTFHHLDGREVVGTDFVSEVSHFLRDWLRMGYDALKDDQEKRNLVLNKIPQKVKELEDMSKCLKGEYSEYYGDSLPESEFEIGKIIGQGGFAVVRQAMWLKKNEPVAIKIFELGIFSDPLQVLKVIRAEVNKLQRFRWCKNVVYCHKVMMGRQQIGIVMELANMNLAELIDSWKGGNTEFHDVTWKECIGRALGAAKGIYFLHQSGAVHRDVKSHNILICGVHTKIADLGQCKLEAVTACTSCRHATAHRGTWQFSAPEALLQQPAGDDKPVDSWAFGAVLYHTATRELPFNSEVRAEVRDSKNWNYAHVVQTYSQGAQSLDEILPLDVKAKHQCPSVLTQLCKACCRNKPDERLTFEDIVDQLAAALLQVPTQKADSVWIFSAQENSGMIDVHEESQNLVMLGIDPECPFDFLPFPKTTFRDFSIAMSRESAKQVVVSMFSGHRDHHGGFAFYDAESDPCSVTQFSQVIRDNICGGGKMECIVLNACATEDLGNTLLKVGVKYVICWADNVHDEKAKCFSHYFFRTLAESFPRDYCLAFQKAQMSADSKFKRGRAKFLCFDSSIEKIPITDSHNHSFYDFEEECLRGLTNPAGQEEMKALRMLNYPLSTSDGQEIREGHGIENGWICKETVRAVLGVNSYQELWGSHGKAVLHARKMFNSVGVDAIFQARSAILNSVQFRSAEQERRNSRCKNGLTWSCCGCKVCRHAYIIQQLLDCVKGLETLLGE